MHAITLQWLQTFASQLESQGGLLPLSLEAPEVFASADNWQSCANDLNSSLAGKIWQCSRTIMTFRECSLLAHF